MTARTCACGATIVAADLNGWDVWLDNQPVNGGLFQVTPRGDTLRAEVTGNGTRQRHECDAVPEPARTGYDWVAPLRPSNVELQRMAAQRSIAAIVVLARNRVPLRPDDAAVAQARVAHPDKTLTEVAAIANVALWKYRRVMARIERKAHQITDQAA